MMNLDHPSEAESHLLYVLLDSNLPTGGFVASSGLESYAKHGFLTPSARANGPIPTTKNKRTEDAVLAFVGESLRNYARSTGPFVADAWRALSGLGRNEGTGLGAEEEILDLLVRLDGLYEAMTLNHVTRRSSTAQGIALLTLYSKSLCPLPTEQTFPGTMASVNGKNDDGEEDETHPSMTDAMAKGQVVERFKRMIRKGETPGHLPVCWGVLTCATGLTINRALHLHLFLHARSLLSSSVRLNLIGPYLSTRILLHPVKTLIEREVRTNEGCETGLMIKRETEKGGMSRNGEEERNGDTDEVSAEHNRVHGDTRTQRDLDWAWADEDEDADTLDPGSRRTTKGPAMTWPLGELIMGRHDLQHTRIFNS